MKWTTIKLKGWWYVQTPCGAILWRQYRWWFPAWRAAKRMQYEELAQARKMR
jgi:hypothetical protein